jgi:hypothetical protein
LPGWLGAAHSLDNDIDLWIIQHLIGIGGLLIRPDGVGTRT